MNESFESQSRNQENLSAIVVEVRDRALLGDDDLQEKIVSFVKKLRASHPDYIKYSLYHVLAGSSPREGDIEFFDFSGEDSVAEFALRHRDLDLEKAA